MKLRHLYKSVLIGFVFFTAGSVFGAMTEEVTELQDEWARLKYLLPAKEQESAFKLLVDKAIQVGDTQQENVEALIWEGIILSTYAGVKGGLDALGLVKKARTVFEKAIEIDPTAMHGSAYTSLGSLYYQVPSWPIGFGNHDKALEYLTRGLEINPNGIDANYFYGDYLMRQGEYARAHEAFDKAMHAPPREGREIADQGRRKEIEAAIEEIKSRQSLVSNKGTSL